MEPTHNRRRLAKCGLTGQGERLPPHRAATRVVQRWDALPNGDQEGAVNPDIQARRARVLNLLKRTRSETRRQLSSIDPELVVHNDERRWRVRDVVGHLGAWNWEAVRSLRAYLGGEEYHCVASEAHYDEYNGPAADLRYAWPLELVWDEYNEAHGQLFRFVQAVRDEKWDGTILYPWNERGTVEQLIEIMMTHESTSHCAAVLRAIG